MTMTIVRKALVFLFLITEYVNSEKTFWRPPVHGGVRSYYVQNNVNNWWSAARSGCTGQDDSLYHDVSLNIPAEVKLSFGTYWVGAMEFSAWNWTDGSGLYEYQGYLSLESRQFSSYDLQDNSALACHRACSYSKFWFGLQGNKCYCLSQTDIKHFIKGSLEDRCPGNYHEWCGNDLGISVYKSDFITGPPKSFQACAYVKVGQDVQIIATNDCTQKKCFVCQDNGRGLSQKCRGGLCIDTTLRPLATAQEICSLAKIDTSNEESLRWLTRWDYFCNGYWVGLEQHPVRKWIDGQDINSTALETDGSASGVVKCLSIQKNFSSSRLYWTDCGRLHKSLCQSVRRPTSPQTTTMTMQPTSVRLTTITDDTSSHSGASTTRTTHVTPGEHAHVREEDKRIEKTSIGVYLGVTILTLSVIALVAFLAVSFRQRKFCFKAYRASKLTNGDNHLNVLYDVNIYDDIVPGKQTGKTLPIARVKPIYQNTSDGHCFETSPQSLAKEDSLKQTYDIPTATKVKDSDSESHYEVPVPMAGTNETAIINAAYDDDEVYDVLGPLDDGVTDKDIGGQRFHDAESNNTGIYEVAGQVSHVQLGDEYQLAGALSTIDANEEKRKDNLVEPTVGILRNTLANESPDGQGMRTINSDFDKQSGQYDTAETPKKKTNAIYDHRIPRSTDGDYDIAFHRRKPSNGPQSETYSHTKQTQESDGYDSTLKGDRVMMDNDDYSHVGEFGHCGFDTPLEHEDEIYQCIDDTHIQVGMESAENITTGNHRFSYA